MEEQKCSVAVLFDVENIYTYGARKDTALKEYSNQQILRAVVSSIDGYAASKICMGGVVAKFAAFSFNAAYAVDKAGDNKGSGKQIFKISAILVNEGWTVLLVPHAQNAADHALVKMSASALSDPEITTLVLVTGDGGEPYKSLIDRFRNSQKAVHVLAYDSLPQEVSGRCDLNTDLISGEVNRILREGYFSEDEEHINEITPEEELRKCVRDFCLDPDNGSILSHRKAFLKRMVRVFDAKFTRYNLDRKTDFYRVLDMVSREVSGKIKKRHPAPTRDELKLILSELINCSDLFERKKVLYFNPKSKLVQALS